MHYIHTGQAPQYLSNCVSTISSSGNRYRLRSCDTDTADYKLPRTRTKFGERGFHYSSPAAWNTLPSDLHDITDTNVFKKRLKTVLFDRAYWLIIVVVRRSWTVRRAAPYKSLIVFVLYCLVCGGLGVSADGTSRSDSARVSVVAALPGGELRYRQQSQWNWPRVWEDASDLQRPRSLVNLLKLSAHVQ